MAALRTALFWLFSSREGSSDRLVPRWIFLRALGLIYCSAFVSLLFQIRGLIGPAGILPADEYLAAGSATLRADGPLLVCAVAVMAGQRIARGHGAVLGGPGRFAAGHMQPPSAG